MRADEANPDFSLAETILASILHHCKDPSWCMHIACSITAAHLHVIDIDGTVWPDWKSSGPAKI